MKTIKIIGICDDGKDSLLPLYEKWIYESDLLIGGERQLAFFSDYKNAKQVIKGGLNTLIQEIEHRSEEKIVLVASGDPLFYGIGGYLAHKLSVEIYPALSSIQLAFAKMKERWDDAYFVSVHGRSMKGLAQKIDGKDKVAILTDEVNSPNAIATYLKEYQMLEYRAFVAENLGGEKEKYKWYSLDELEESTFSPLNVVILKKQENGPKWTIGIDDDQFFQRKPGKGLITKKEIRMLSISELKVEIDSVVWDIGTCTGSMAIEAGRIAKEGAIFAIEKNEYDLENCYRNLRKFRVDATVVHGKAPDHLASFPNPDCIFIGGTAGNLEAILNVCCEQLKIGGRIVLNAVTIETLSEAMSIFKRKNVDVFVTHAQIAKSKSILHLTMFEPLNPIYIIVAVKKEGAGE